MAGCARCSGEQGLAGKAVEVRKLLEYCVTRQDVDRTSCQESLAQKCLNPSPLPHTFPNPPRGNIYFTAESTGKKFTACNGYGTGLCERVWRSLL